MQDKLQVLNSIQNIDFDALDVRLWVIKKSTKSGLNSYKALSASINGLDGDLILTLHKFFLGLTNHVEPIRELSAYSALTVDTDEDRALVHSVDDTDFSSIIEKIRLGADNEPVTDIQQFHNAWALVVEFNLNENQFYAFSKVKGGWNLKRVSTLSSWTFSDGDFKKVEVHRTFAFRDYFDFVAYGQDVFIRDKANYELGLNIREGLEAKRDILVDALAENGIITSVNDLKIAIGTNKTLLRRLVSAEETRYFEDQQFIEDMKDIISEHEWQINVDADGKFIIDENNIDLFLKLINDKRFISLIKKQMVDADRVEIVKN
ncbi:Kiwa anti-phage protein KwaB-like domain-containing protein [Photobacterium leiognathi subsp. mandapamensis]